MCDLLHTTTKGKIDSSVKTSSTAPICCQATTRSGSEHPCATTGCGQYVEHDATRGFYEGIKIDY
jgi:hypothetical protein